MAYGFFLVASLGEGGYLANHGFVSLGSSQLKISSLLATVCLVLLIFSLRDGNGLTKGWVAWLGKYSYPIYLSHNLFLVALNAVGHPVNWFPVYALMSALISLIICVALILAARNWIPERFSGKWLGV